MLACCILVMAAYISLVMLACSILVMAACSSLVMLACCILAMAACSSLVMLACFILVIAACSIDASMQFSCDGSMQYLRVAACRAFPALQL